MYECKICGKGCKTIQGLLSHKRLKHGITQKKAAVQDEIERKVATEDPRATHLRVEKELLEREKRELQNRFMQYEENGIDKIRERNFRLSAEEVNEKRAEKISENLTLPLPLSPPPLPPLPPPPFMETLTEKIKRLNERTLFR